MFFCFFFSSRRRHTRCALVTGVQTCALPIYELIARYNDEDDVRDLLDLALQLEDLTRNAGKHAGGVVIAPTPLSDFCPLFAEHDGDGHGRNPVTQFDKDDVEAVGLVKFDFLGLRTLTDRKSTRLNSSH